MKALFYFCAILVAVCCLAGGNSNASFLHNGNTMRALPFRRSEAYRLSSLATRPDKSSTNCCGDRGPIPVASAELIMPAAKGATFLGNVGFFRFAHATPAVEIDASFDGREQKKEVKVHQPYLSAEIASGLIVICAALGFAFAMYWWYVISEIEMDPTSHRYSRFDSSLTADTAALIYNISVLVSDGAMTFLRSEYKYMGIFMSGFGCVLFIFLGLSLSNGTVETPWMNASLSTFSFFVGGISSVAAGWVGMRIAVYANSRTAVMAAEGGEDISRGFVGAFQTAFRGGVTMGFALTSMGVFSLFLTIKVVSIFFTDDHTRIHELYECVAAFGLGGSAVACFGRVGGGIFTKAADVGADLVGKVEKNIPEDDPRNPGVIADCIGDNVGDIAGMGSDLFGSFGEATCAALIIAAGSAELSASHTAMLYPLLITASGIIVSMITASLAAVNSGVRCADHIEPALKRQLFISTGLATIVLTAITWLSLPDEFTVLTTHTTKWRALVCVLCGLWSGLFIGCTTEYYTSSTYRPVREVAESCETGAATNIIYGLALGYQSVVPPVLAMATTIFISYRLCNLYGFALAALGILSTMATALTIDAYGPISDNAGGFVEMAGLGEEVREVTDALDAAGNTTAAIGKGFAIGSAAFVSLALYGAFVARVEIPSVNILDERVLPGLLVGAMLPFVFTAMTMKSVGIAAMDMVREIRRQFTDPRVASGEQAPDYAACVSIATEAALHEMIAPALLVLLSPIVVGILFGKHSLAGLLPGALIAGVQLAISSSNTGGAWDNAKKYIEKGGLGRERNRGKGSPQHAAAVIGDTVGDPLKDTSGPSLNILIKLIAIISVVFAPVFTSRMGGVLMSLVGDNENH